MKKKYIQLNTPEGLIVVDSSKIASVAECLKHGINDTTVRCEVYVSEQKDSFNILETYGQVLAVLQDLGVEFFQCK